MASPVKNKPGKRLIKKLKIKNALTLPKTILQILQEKKSPPKSSVKDALDCIDEIIVILDEL